MKFEEVLSTLREGKKIRRTFWWKEHYIKLVSDGIVDQDGKKLTFGKDDLLCLEWEIVRESKKVKLRDLTEEQYKKWIKNNCSKYDGSCYGCPFQKVKCFINDAWYLNKDRYSDKFLDQEVEVEE